MKDTTLVVAGLLTLSAGTFAFRFSGPVLRQRLAFPPWANSLLEAAGVVLLAALAATTALTEGHGADLEKSFGPGRDGDPLAQHRAGEPERERPGGQREQAGHNQSGVLHGAAF